jgi:hypothetical protein
VPQEASFGREVQSTAMFVVDAMEEEVLECQQIGVDP